MAKSAGPVAHIGLIEVLGRRLYSGKITWLREYIQNSIDAGARHVRIGLDGTVLEIEDDGRGMDGATLSEQAFSIGKRTKDEAAIGELGVGIFAGTGICDRIRVQTRAQGKHAVEASLDMVKFREIRDAKLDVSFEQGMEEIFSVGELTSGEPPLTDKATFTRIRFEGLNSDTLALLGSEDISAFVERTVNVPIDTKFPLKNNVEAFLAKNDYCVDVSVSLNGSSSKVRKFANLKVELAKTPWLRDIFDNGRLIAKTWAAYNIEGEAVSDARILVKQKGLTVGDETAVESRFGAKDSRRFYGEIVILDDRIQINTSRDWFVESPELRTLVRKTKEALGELHSIANFDSTTGIVIVNLAESRDRALQARGESQKMANYGTANQKAAKVASLDKKIQSKLGDLKSISFLLDRRKVSSSPQADELKLELAKRVLDHPRVKLIGTEPGAADSNPKKPRRSPLPQAVRNFLTLRLIDPELADRIGIDRDAKDTTDRAFTFVEQLLKVKVGRKENEHADWRVLLREFKSKYRPANLKGADEGAQMEAFDRIMEGFHTVLRNPSNHTFLDDMNNPRSILQVIMISDFLVGWVKLWEPRTVK